MLPWKRKRRIRSAAVSALVAGSCGKVGEVGELFQGLVGAFVLGIISKKDIATPCMSPCPGGIPALPRAPSLAGDCSAP
jgi:hypothetical protein